MAKLKRFRWKSLLLTLGACLFLALGISSDLALRPQFAHSPRASRAPASLASVGASALGMREWNQSNKVLVLYNSNHPEAVALARSYQSKRGVPAQNLCGAPFPVSDYSSFRHFKGARDLILRNCLCKLIPPAQRPNPCDETAIDRIAARSSITHLAILKGIPRRLTETPWLGDGEDPSLDYFLAKSLYDPEILSESYTGGPPRESTYIATAERGRYSPRILPLRDRILAYGRIEAITFPRTHALIDRTLESERQGFVGNVFLGHQLTQIQDDSTAFFSKLLGTPPGCGPGAPEDCSLQVAFDGAIPGEPSGSLPLAVNASFFFNPVFNNNGQSAFDGFDSLLGWRKSKGSCLTLCSQFSSDSMIAECRARSTDYFRELNTDCVGGGPGLLGNQVRSYTSQYYGFYPRGFVAPWGGDLEKTPPTIESDGPGGSAFRNEKFQDSRFLRFGSLVASLERHKCLGLNGSLELCPAKLPIAMGRYMGAAELQGYELSQDTHIRFRYRNQASGSGSRLMVRFLRYDAEERMEPIPSFELMLQADHLSWQEAHWIVPPSSLSNLGLIYFGFQAPFEAGLHGVLDLDGLEIYQERADGSRLEIIPLEIGSFNSNQNWVTDGDWASNAMDRLGAIAWWGSASHFATGGFAFKSARNLQEQFFGGRTLGEALAATGASAVSGTAWGDPLYSPVGVRVYSQDPALPLNSIEAVYVSTKKLSKSRDLWIHAFNGTQKTAEVSWQLSSCPSLDSSICDRKNSWQPRSSGQGAVYGLSVLNLKSLIPDPSVCGAITLKLRLQNHSSPERPLFHSVSVKYGPFDQEPQPGPPVDSDGFLLADLNRDGKVDTMDLTVLLGAWGSPHERADLNGDGMVSTPDLASLLSYWGVTPGPPGPSCSFE